MNTFNQNNAEVYAFARLKFADITQDLREELNTFAKDWVAPQDFWTSSSILESMASEGLDLWVVTLSEQQNAWAAIAVTRTTLDHAELLYIHTHRVHRGFGLARRLLTHVCTRLLSQSSQVREMYLEVRSSNLSAIALYNSVGFKEDGIRKKYYQDGEDAKIMRFVLNH